MKENLLGIKNKSTQRLILICLVIIFASSIQAQVNTNTTNNSTVRNQTNTTATLQPQFKLPNFDELSDFNYSQSFIFNRVFKFKGFFFLSRFGYITGQGAYFLALGAIVMMAFSVEVLNYFRFNIQAKLFQNLNPLIDYDDDTIHIPGRIKVLLGFIYMISAILSYLLLLLAFQLDVGIYLAILIGYTVGYGIFGFRRRKSYIYLYNPKSDKCQFEIET